jgi:polyphosphate glucokinase
MAATEKLPLRPYEVPKHLPQRILTVDIGGTKLKILATGQTEPRKSRSGRSMTPRRMVETVRRLAGDWEYDAVSMGFPGLVGQNGPRSEPANLGSGWVGFDYSAAFERPVRIINDAAMQALGSYEGGRMLFLGLGTGVGSALVAQNIIVTLELGQLPFRARGTINDLLGRQGLARLKKKQWREVIHEVVPILIGAFVADYVVIGGGNSKQVKTLPPGARLGNNLTAFRGGFRLWHLEDVPTLSPEGTVPPQSWETEWRLL